MTLFLVSLKFFLKNSQCWYSSLPLATQLILDNKKVHLVFEPEDKAIKNYGRDKGRKKLYSKKMGKSVFTALLYFKASVHHLSSDHAPPSFKYK